MKLYGGTHADSWNREHVWVKSHGFPAKKDTAYTDIHHLRPADRSLNSTRGVKDFDEGGYPISEAPGSFTDYDSFEPRDQIKGDIARMLFYMAVRYENKSTYDLTLRDKTGTYGASLGKLSTLLKWHKLDPVDEKERKRNETIYQKYQHNRNPFIDHPEYVSKIWNSIPEKTELKLANRYLTFENTTIGSQSTPIHYVISGVNLKSDVTIIAPQGYRISLENENKFQSKLILSPISGKLNQLIDIVFEPIENRDYFDSLNYSSNKSDLVKLNLFGRGISSNTIEILSESFEDKDNEWTTYSVAGKKNWRKSSYGNRQFMKISGFKGDEPCNDWLLSPTLDLENFSEIILTFETAKNHNDIIEGLEIFVSTDYQNGKNPQNYKWTKVTGKMSQGKYLWALSGCIDITKFSGNSTTIAFKYSNSSIRKASTWEIDDIILTGEKK